MGDNPGISVIIPCYNAGEHIEECVNSILQQGFNDAPYEIIIVDDGSTDENTHAILDRFEDEYSDQITVLSHDINIGQSAARNNAIDHAQYDYIMPIDADDALSTQWKQTSDIKGYMQEAYQRISQNEDLAIVYCNAELTGAKEEFWKLPEYSEQGILVNNMIPVYGMYRKSEAEEIGGYNENLQGWEDWNFWIGLLNNRIKQDKPAEVERIDTPHYLYTQHDNGSNVNAAHPHSLGNFYRTNYSEFPEIYAKHISTILPQMIINGIYDKVPDSVKVTGFFKQFVNAVRGKEANPAVEINNVVNAETTYEYEDHDSTPE